MRLLICGGRDYADQRRFDYCMAQVDERHRIDVVIEDFLRGAATMARLWALYNDRILCSYPPDWATYGPGADTVRDRQMLVHGKPDLVLAFPGDRLTANMCELARRAGVTVWRA